MIHFLCTELKKIIVSEFFSNLAIISFFTATPTINNKQIG